MEFDKKDNELIDEITDYFERKYGTAIVIVTKKEIEELKKCDNLAIDWNKAEIEEVDDDGKED